MMKSIMLRLMKTMNQLLTQATEEVPINHLSGRKTSAALATGLLWRLSRSDEQFITPGALDS